MTDLFRELQWETEHYINANLKWDDKAEFDWSQSTLSPDHPVYTIRNGRFRAKNDFGVKGWSHFDVSAKMSEEAANRVLGAGKRPYGGQWRIVSFETKD